MNLDRIIAVRTDKTIYRDGDKCLKVFVSGRPASDIYREAMNQSIFCEKGFRTPKALEVTCIDGKWALVSEFVRGRTLAMLMAEEPERRSEYLAEFVRIHHAIHAETSSALRSLKVSLTECVDTLPLELVVRNELRLRIDAMPDSTHICHGDFDPSNIIVTDSGEMYITDCPLAVSGSPEFDCAVTYHKLLLNYDGYAEEYLDLFCKSNDKVRAAVRYLSPVAAASMLGRSNAEKRRRLTKSIIDSLSSKEQFK